MLLTIAPSNVRLYMLTQGTVIATHASTLLFIFISGILLLPYREESISVFLRKRVLNVVLPLLVYACFYIRLVCISHASAEAWITYYFKKLIGGSIPEAPHLWLVYILIALYLVVIPFRYLFKNMPEWAEKQLTLLILFLLCVNTASSYWGQPMGIQCFLSDWPGIFMLGYLFTRNWMRKYDLPLVAGGAVSFCVSLWIANSRADYKQIVCNQSILMTLMSLAVLVIVFHMEPWLKTFRRILSVCSQYSYSVLLIHWYVLSTFIYNGWMPSAPSVAVQIILPFFVCLTLSFLCAVLVDHLIVSVLECALKALPQKVLSSLKK